MHLLYRGLKAIFRAMRRDLYFVHSRAIWTDDPNYDVVQLRNRIIDLVEDRTSEVIGVTEPVEIYLLAPGDDRYALARIRGEEIIEGTYFERGWPSNVGITSPFRITPRLLEIRGKPYKITKRDDPRQSKLILKVES